MKKFGVKREIRYHNNVHPDNISEQVEQDEDDTEVECEDDTEDTEDAVECEPGSLDSMIGFTVRVFMINGSVILGELSLVWGDAITLTNAGVRTQGAIYSCDQMLIYMDDIQAVGTLCKEFTL